MARKTLFDRKFGVDFIDRLSLLPGVYQIFDQEQNTIYVGKAKRLRRRLQQYRNIRRIKKHRKMKQILKDAHSIEIHECATETDALLLENQLIQKLKPKYNIAGAYAFLYPSLCLRQENDVFHLAYTTSVKSFQESGFSCFGSFRSRIYTKNAYYSLAFLLGFVSYKLKNTQRNRLNAKYSLQTQLRKFPEDLFLPLSRFLSGKNTDFLRILSEQLLEKPDACRASIEVQDHLKELKQFYLFEARRLHTASKKAKYPIGYIQQEERDRLFILANQGNPPVHPQEAEINP